MEHAFKLLSRQVWIETEARHVSFSSILTDQQMYIQLHLHPWEEPIVKCIMFIDLNLNMLSEEGIF